MAKKASKRSRIGFIGLGDIGLPMAVNIARAGFDLTVFDLRKPVMRAAVRQGAKAAGSLAELKRAKKKPPSNAFEGFVHRRGAVATDKPKPGQ